MNAASAAIDHHVSENMALSPCHHRLVLTGFMGAGKTTVGHMLAARLSWEFLDLDALIEARANMKIPAIFAVHGESYFRRLESQVLASTLSRSHIVLALGGGAPEVLTNRQLLEQTPGTATIFLDAPFSVLLDRCMAQAISPEIALRDGASTASFLAQSRPVLADPEAAERRFRARHPIYSRLAHHTVQTAELSTEETVAAIVSKLGPARASLQL